MLKINEGKLLSLMYEVEVLTTTKIYKTLTNVPKKLSAISQTKLVNRPAKM